MKSEKTMTLEECLLKIEPVSREAMSLAKKRWDNIAKPLHGLGKLEDLIISVAGITGSADISIQKKILVPFCADNGVVAEGVSQTGQEVTAIVAENFSKQATSAAIMCEQAGVTLHPIDVGMAVDVASAEKRKFFYGTQDFLKEPAMSREHTILLIETGIDVALYCKKAGYQLLLTGEMGIGNTTTSAAVTSVLLGVPPKEIAGKGAGLSEEGLQKKRTVIEAAIKKWHPDKEDTVDVLSKVGGADLAALCGFYLGGAACRLPIVADGFIAKTAALAAKNMKKEVLSYILPSHRSKEQGDVLLTKALGMEPILDAQMCLGEGTGAVALCPLLDMAAAVYQKMGTFAENEIEAYHDYMH